MNFTQKKIIILLIAHGSRKQAANQEVIHLAQKLSQKSSQKIIGCFLEIAQPDIPTALERAIKEKPDMIKILPYFLTQGRHVTEDIPRIVNDKMQSTSPHTEIKWMDYIGSQVQLEDLILNLI